MKELLKDIFAWLPALTPLVIGSLGAYIAYQQWKTNDLKVKHDLYDRRLAIYNALMEFLVNVMRIGNVDHGALLEFNRKKRESYFLFDSDIADYLKTVYDKAVDLDTARSDFANMPDGEERTRLINSRCELEKWMGKQLTVAPTRFAKHMQLG